jgi:hypothetical protein
VVFDEHVIERPVWADAVVEVVRESMQPLGFIGHLGYRLWDPDALNNPFDGWMLAVFPTPNEWHGGSMDGAKAVSGFRLNVHRVTEVFTKIEHVVWSTPVHYNGDMDGPELVVQGTVLGKRVLLRVFNVPPPDEPVSYVVDPAKGEAWRRRPEEEG